MSTSVIEKKIAELKELEEMENELKAEIEAIKDELKNVLVEQNTEELVVGTSVIRYTTVLSQRLDSTQLKKKLPEIYTAYLKQVTSKRFSIG